MRSLLEPTFGGLLGALGPLLGGSWASLGGPWASKMGPKRVRDIGKRVFVIPSCFFLRLFSLRSASGSPLGRVLAPSWPHLAQSWVDFSRFFVNFRGFLVDFGVHNGWTVGSIKNGPNRLKTTRPGGMRAAIRRPGFAGHGVLDSCLCLRSAVLALLSRSCQVLPGPGRSWMIFSPS